jgi:hypothetical protein
MSSNDIKQLTSWQALLDDDPSTATYDALAMMYPLPNLENVEDVRADTEFFEWNSGQKVRIRQGVRTFTGAIPNETPAMLGNLQDWEGVKFGVYVFDVDGNLICTYNETDDEFRPIPVDGNSFDAKYMLPTYTDPTHIMIQFDYAADFNDKNLWLIPMDDATGLDFDGRTDLKANTSIHGSTEFDTTVGTEVIKVFLKLDYNVWAEGFKVADFKYWDDSTTSWLTIDGANLVFTEPTGGSYYFTAGTVTPATGDYVAFIKDGYQSYSSDKWV